MKDYIKMEIVNNERWLNEVKEIIKLYGNTSECDSVLKEYIFHKDLIKDDVFRLTLNNINFKTFIDEIIEEE